MQLVKAGYEIFAMDGVALDGPAILRFIERVARTCYKSEDKIGPGTAERMVRGLLSRDPPHEAMLEFYDIVVKFTTDRGVSHELVRHRLASYAQESTRFCDYGKKGVTFIIPPWVNVIPGEFIQVPTTTNPADAVWLAGLLDDERRYNQLRELGWSPQQARDILPNSLKTEIVSKFNLREWRHVFHMRIFENAHPQMREIMRPLLAEFKLAIPIIFDDIQWEVDLDAVPTKLTCPSLRKAARDEPIFVLRAQDEIAPSAIYAWCDRAAMRGVPQAKMDHAIKIAQAMEKWPKQKLPD